jgi:hypothetical protein
MTAITNVQAPIAYGPYVTAFAVTKSDDTVFSPPTRALYIGGAGNVAVIMNGDTAAVTFTAPVAGTILPLSVTKVMSTNTSASAIVGLR